MNTKLIWRIVAYILLLEILMMLPACWISLFEGETNVVHAYIVSILIIACVSCVILLLTRKAKRGRFYSREGLVTTGLTWIMMSALGCLPFVIIR